jgi:hypothetical protein
VDYLPGRRDVVHSAELDPLDMSDHRRAQGNPGHGGVVPQGVIAVLALLLAALLLPAAAEAKVTCAPVDAEPGVPLRGLPEHPVARRTYPLAVTLLDRGVNPTPHLGAEYCGDDRPHHSAAGAGGWFRRVRGSGGGYALDLRFPFAGPWAASFMDRDGGFHELGVITVLPANGISPAAAPRLATRDVPPLRRPLGQVLWIFAS